MYNPYFQSTERNITFDKIVVIGDDIGFVPSRRSPTYGNLHNTVELWIRLALSKHLLPENATLILEFVETVFKLPDGKVINRNKISYSLVKKVEKLGINFEDLKVIKSYNNMANEPIELEETLTKLKQKMSPEIDIIGEDDRNRTHKMNLGYWEEESNIDSLRETLEIDDDKIVIIVVGNYHAEGLRERLNLNDNQYIKSANDFLVKNV